MALDWMPSEGGTKDHKLWGTEHFGTEAPCTQYEERPILDAGGKAVEALHSAWQRRNRYHKHKRSEAGANIGERDRGSIMSRARKGGRYYLRRARTALIQRHRGPF